MKNVWKSALAAVVLVAPSLAMAATWVTDPASTRASFTVTHLMVSTVGGQFGKVSATVNIDDNDITRSTVEATIDAASINTDNPRRDAHLKSVDFFDVANHPTLTFKSKKVEQVASGKLKVTGDLTMRGVTKEVVLDVTGPSAEQKDPNKPGTVRRSASATTRINRKDFGLNWNRALEAGGVAVSEEVNITLELALVRDTPAPAAAKGAKGTP
jgi:polyisoprenoid-binding protein YceI